MAIISDRLRSSASGSMRDVSDKHRSSAAGSIEHVSEPIDAQTAADSLKYGPRGALLVAGISVALLFLGWLAFYFLLFMPRGPVG